jgi:hypothetical protein
MSENSKHKKNIYPRINETRFSICVLFFIFGDLHISHNQLLQIKLLNLLISPSYT